MKYLYVIFLLTLSLSSFGQKVGIAIKLGGGLATQSVKNNDIISTTSTGAFNFGGVAIFRMHQQWELQSGLEIAQKGAIITEDAITTTQQVYYIDLPINMVRNFAIPGLGAYYIGAGGYAARAIGGDAKFETPNSETSAALEFKKDGDLQRYDAGINFTTGLKLNNKLLFDISYQLGLANLATSPLKDTGTRSIKSRLTTVSLGYSFR